MKENAIISFTPPAILRVSKSSGAGINMHRPIVIMAVNDPMRMFPTISQKQIVQSHIVKMVVNLG
jgi:hypothetical protein